MYGQALILFQHVNSSTTATTVITSVPGRSRRTRPAKTRSGWRWNPSPHPGWAGSATRARVGFLCQGRALGTTPPASAARPALPSPRHLRSGISRARASIPAQGNSLRFSAPKLKRCLQPARLMLRGGGEPRRRCEKREARPFPSAASESRHWIICAINPRGAEQQRGEYF